MLSRFVVLLRIAFVNITSSLLSFFIGLVLLFGAALLVVGGSLFSTLDNALSKSIVGSVSGHVQVYAARSKDPLEIYGKIDGSDSNLAPIENFASLKKQLLALPNVARVVPMGSTTAMVRTASPLTEALESLRGVHRNQQTAETRVPAETFAALSQKFERRVRTMAEVLAKDTERAKELNRSSAEQDAERAAVLRAASEEFWQGFAKDPFGNLEFLENKVAPLADVGDMVFVRCLGTDLDAYQKTFDRMTIVEGGPVPEGHRGVLLPRFFMEEYLKLKNARRIDKIRDARQAGRSLDDEADKELQRFVRENQAQTRDLILQLDAEQAALATTRLQALLGTEERDLGELLKSFFAMKEANFEVRYKFFYDELAPFLRLYRVRVGEAMTLSSVGKSGSAVTASVRVFGVFDFNGLEKSPLAGVNALLDLVTFRELYGFLTAEGLAEIEAIKAATKMKVVARESAEDELFAAPSAEGEPEATLANEAVFNEATTPKRARVKSETFPVSEVDDGVVMHVAVMLKDGSDAAQARAVADIERLAAGDGAPPDVASLSAAKALVESSRLPQALRSSLREVVEGEGARSAGAMRLPSAKLLELQAALKAARGELRTVDLAAVTDFVAKVRPALYVVPWSDASGFLGKFISFFRVTLLAVVLAFAFIALVVVTVGMTIATLQRTSTIGTLRAIGAQRQFVVSMVIVETVVLALLFGGLGAGLGVAIVQYLHATGIPAVRDELYFFFSGPVLRPVLTAQDVVLSVAVTLGVSVLAVLLPVVLATRIAPITAMQTTE